MENLIQVAGEAMSTTRRSFLSALPGLAAASAIPTVIAVDGRTAHAAPGPSPIVAGPRENPDLLRAYDELIASHAELAEAQDALEWLADEWRHLWPLAPEVLLGGANAHIGSCGNNAERDIIGRFMMRDTADLTKRLSRKFRMKGGKTCFSVFTSEECQKHIDFFTAKRPEGRTERALANNRAWIKDQIAWWKQRLVPAREYEAETARLRRESGVQNVKQRIADADLAMCKSRLEISKILAFTHEGLRIKAEALMMTGLFDGPFTTDGLLGEMGRFIQAVKMAQGQQPGSAQ